MSIKVVQTCDGCGIFRTIDNQRTDSQNGGWREVKNNTHLCPTCINAAIKITRPDQRTG